MHSSAGFQRRAAGLLGAAIPVCALGLVVDARQCLILMSALNQVLRLALVAGSGGFAVRAVWLSVPAVYAVTCLQRRDVPPVSAAATRRVVSGLLALAGGLRVASFVRARWSTAQAYLRPRRRPAVTAA